MTSTVAITGKGSFTLPRSWLILSRPSGAALEGSAHRKASPFVIDSPVEVVYPPMSRKLAMPSITTKGGDVASEVAMVSDAVIRTRKASAWDRRVDIQKPTDN
jgi:uncharacterized protein YijF (DUF1287 family)